MLVEERQAVMLQMPFDQIKANLANIQPENLQNVQKSVLGKKLHKSMG